ncbi:hypothetical protein D3C81_1128840 [compost metagenome]
MKIPPYMVVAGGIFFYEVRSLYEKYITPDSFLYDCRYAPYILEFVENIPNSDTRWFMDHGFVHLKNEERYTITFKGFGDVKFKKYILILEVSIDLHTKECCVEIVKRIDNT